MLDGRLALGGLELLDFLEEPLALALGFEERLFDGAEGAERILMLRCQLLGSSELGAECLMSDEELRVRLLRFVPLGLNLAKRILMGRGDAVEEAGVGRLLLRESFGVLCLDRIGGGGVLIGDGALRGDVLFGEEGRSA